MACRGLPPRERFWGMVFGAGVASILLILFTGIVATLLKLPYLKLAGGLALFWVAVKLVAPQAHDAEDTPRGRRRPVARGAGRGRRQHRHEPRQRDRGGGRRQRQLCAARAGTRGQHSDRHRRQCAVPGHSRAVSRRRVGGRRAARLDRRRAAAGRPRSWHHIVVGYDHRRASIPPIRGSAVPASSSGTSMSSSPRSYAGYWVRSSWSPWACICRDRVRIAGAGARSSRVREIAAR